MQFKALGKATADSIRKGAKGVKLHLPMMVKGLGMAHSGVPRCRAQYPRLRRQKMGLSRQGVRCLWWGRTLDLNRNI